MKENGTVGFSCASSRAVFVFIGTRIAFKRDRHPRSFAVVRCRSFSFWIDDSDSCGSSTSRRKCPSSPDIYLATLCTRQTRSWASCIRCSECICESKSLMWYCRSGLIGRNIFSRFFLFIILRISKYSVLRLVLRARCIEWIASKDELFFYHGIHIARKSEEKLQRWKIFWIKYNLTYL